MAPPTEEKPIDGRLRRVPCSVMRGGTSRAVFFREGDLPADPVERDRIILSVMGSPHPRQIDGLGGADTLTSKIAIVAPASGGDAADVRFTFGQVAIDRPVVDYDVSCGNITAAVGYYAIEEGLVDAIEPTTTVHIRDESSGLFLTTEIPVEDGVPRVTGEFAMHGAPGTGARVNVGFVDPGGSTTGEGLLPTGSPRNTTTVDGRTIEYSFVDAGNPFVFVRASAFDCTGTEMPEDIDDSESLLDRIEQVRVPLAVDTGMATDRRDALENKTVLPAVVLVGRPATYTDYEGDTVRMGEVSLLCRMVVDRKLHKSYAGTGTVCTGIASLIDGTIVEEYARPFPDGIADTRVTIGHPSGTIDAFLDTGDDGTPRRVLFSRTARRLLDGVAYARPELPPQPR